MLHATPLPEPQHQGSRVLVTTVIYPKTPVLRHLATKYCPQLSHSSSKVRQRVSQLMLQPHFLSLKICQILFTTAQVQRISTDLKPPG